MNGAIKKAQLTYYPASERYDVFDSSKKKVSSYEFTPKLNFPIIFHNFNLDLSSHIGSPSGFFFGGLDLSSNTEILINRGTEFQLQLSKTVFSNYDDLNYDPAFTDLPPVRTNIQNYLKNESIRIDELNTKIIRNYSNHYFMGIFGIIEQMFGGAHLEYLYKPFNSLFSYGLQVSYAKQRTTDQLLDFTDYSALIGHASLLFYEPKLKIKGEFSYGRYLAKDDGYTIDISRQFSNGSEIGAFFTRTNVSNLQFGEGSFDKGIYIKYPLIKLFAPKNITDNRFNKYTYRPLTRDGGAKLMTSKNLHDLTIGASKYDYMTGW